MAEGKRRRYTEEYKAEIIKRLMPPNNESVVAISREGGVPEGTLYKWRQSARIDGNATPGNGQTSDKWSSQDKFLVVVETFSMNEHDLAAYCRKKGLYREQIIAWRKICLQANDQSTHQAKELTSELKSEKKRTKELERDLQKKDKALAEAAALLLLRKKARAIWGATRKND